MRRALARIPIRVRVTLAFTGAMAIVLAAVALFLLVRLRTELDVAIDAGLRSRANDLVAFVEVQTRDGDLATARPSPLTERGEALAQVVDARGAVVDATPSLRRTALVGPATRARAADGPVLLTVPRGPGVGREGARALATRAQTTRGPLTVVVATSSEARDEAVRSLGSLLVVGGPIALLLASLAGYGAAAAALRPVERMRRRATDIQLSLPGERLPVPEAADELRRLGETLNAMLGRIELSLERERVFVADASHELRTPLAILKAELELAMRGEPSAGELRLAVRSAAEETDRLVQLAEDLLVVARLDQGRLPIRRERIAVAEVLDGVEARFRHRAAEQGTELVVADPGDLVLHADPLRLEQAVGGLVENALRHGGPHVELSARVAEDRVELHVRDDGEGFPEAFLPSAFERFTRADAARRRGGSGLGLAIVRAVARAHEGEAEAANGPEGGADVWLSIPR